MKGILFFKSNSGEVSVKVLVYRSKNAVGIKFVNKRMAEYMQQFVPEILRKQVIYKERWWVAFYDSKQHDHPLWDQISLFENQDTE
jgi:hypothetical protein